MAAILSLLVVGSASAATVECSGSVTESEKATEFEYEFGCLDVQGIEGQPEPLTGFSLISTKKTLGFSPDVQVFDPSGEVVGDESFACEGPFPGYGFGCGGTMSTGQAAVGEYEETGPNTAVGQLELVGRPCNKKGRKSKWSVWITAATNRVDPVKGTSKPVTTEPFKLKTPKCPKLDEGKGGKGGKGKGGKGGRKGNG